MRLKHNFINHKSWVTPNSLRNPRTLKAAMVAKVAKGWSLPRFYISIPSGQKIWGKILALAWLKFAVAAQTLTVRIHSDLE